KEPDKESSEYENQEKVKETSSFAKLRGTVLSIDIGEQCHLDSRPCRGSVPRMPVRAVTGRKQPAPAPRRLALPSRYSELHPSKSHRRLKTPSKPISRPRL